MPAKAKFIPRPPEPPHVIEARWKKKKERIHELANGIRRLRVNITRDLKSDDEKTFLTALIIAVMDRTAERIGNGDSEANGHHGVTGFKKNHITIIGNKIHLDYIGKSGVNHEKSFSDSRLAKALKKAIKNSPSPYIFTTSDGLRIRAAQVNKYLSEFNISAKDLRGYAANRLVIEKLNSIEPEETDKKRKKQLNKILKQVAAKIGHGTATLKKHYLIPELPTAFVDKGKIIDIKSLGYMEQGGETGDECCGCLKGKYEVGGQVGQQVKSKPVVYQIIPDDESHIPSRSDINEAIWDAKAYYESGKHKKVVVKDNGGKVVLSLASFGDYYARFGNLLWNA